MISRRTLLKTAAVGGTAAALGTGLNGCSGGDRDPDKVSLWGVGGAEQETQQKVIDAFVKDHPGVTIDAKNVPSNGNDGDATPVITAVRGGTAPDLWWMDRFAGAQFASLGLLEPIDSLVEKYESDDFWDQYLPFTLDELRYKGKIYGLPTSTDTRGLFYNKTLMRKAGFDPDELDMSNSPVTVDRLFEMADKINKKDKRGNYTRLGIQPWHGQGWGYTWSVGLDAQYFDDKACEMDMRNPGALKAHTMLYDYARKYGYPQMDAFIKSYEPLNAPPNQSAFMSGKLGFDISNNPTAVTIKKYAPDLDWGYTHLPVWNKGDQPYTWSGGFSLAMPKGSSMSRSTWEFMKYYAGIPGLSIYCPATGGLPTISEMFDLEALKSQKVWLDQLKYSTSRPPIPIGQLWWDSLDQAQGSVTIGSKTPTEALDVAQARVAGQMETFCPFKLPADYGKTGF